MNTKKKTWLMLLIVVVAITTLSVTLVGCKKPDPIASDSIELNVDMADQYYVGTNGAIDLTKIFPDQKCEITSGDSATISGNTLTVSKAAPFGMKVGKIDKKVTVIDGAYNVSTYTEFADKVKAGEKVAVQATKFEMTKDIGTLTVSKDIYGNGLDLNAHEVAKATGTDKKPFKNAGSSALYVYTPNKVVIRDIHVFGKVPNKDDTIKAYNNYGPMLNIDASHEDNKGAKANVDVFHSIFENSHKVVHIRNANVNMEGCFIRNAADSTVSIATFKGHRSVVNMKNNVISNSVTAGIVMYCYDGNVKDDGDPETWNELNINGFLDIYNWRSVKTVTFLPDTELSGNVTMINWINDFVNSTVKPDDKYTEMKAIGKDGNRYIHMGIFKISSSPKDNKSVINIDENIGYKINPMPMPSMAKAFLKSADVAGYFANNEGSVKVEDSITKKNLPQIYKELREGR